MRIDISALIVFLFIGYVVFFGKEHLSAICWRVVYLLWHHASLHRNGNKIEITSLYGHRYVIT